jgi:hypothetical protein
MNIDDAIYHAAHHYPGGIPALAARMGANPGTLQNKVNPRFTTATPTLRDLEAIVTFTQSPLPAGAIAELCGHIVIPVVLPAGAGDIEILESITQLATDFGAVCRSVHEALQDRRVTKREIETIERHAQELIGAVQVVLSRMRALQQEPPPDPHVTHLRRATAG